MFYHSLPPMHLIFSGWLIAWEDTPWCEHDWKGCLGVDVEFRRAEREQGRQANWKMERSGEPSLHGVVFISAVSLLSSPRIHLTRSDVQFFTDLFLAASTFLFCFFPTSSLIFPLISWPLLFRYFSLLNSSHLIFILTTTFFLSLPLCFQVSRGKKRGEEARDGASFF